MIISVIVPVYNTGIYLSKCLDSILKQSYSKIEVIVVNDGSPDNSQTIIDDYVNKDSRVVSVIKENGGLASARNAGLFKASGDYVCFVDSDDWVTKDFVKDFVDVLIENPTIDIVISKNYIYDSILKKYVIRNNGEWDSFCFSAEEKEEKIELKHIGPRRQCDLREAFDDTIMCVWKNCYRTSLIKDNGVLFFDERQIMLEDYDFNIRAYHLAQTVRVISKCNYVYVLHEGSLSKKYRKNYYSMVVALYNRTNEYLDSRDYLFPDKARERLNAFFAQCLVEIIINRTYSKDRGIKAFIRSIAEAELSRSVLKSSGTICLPFYYRFFLFLLRRRLYSICTISSVLVRRLYYFYRLYMARGLNSVKDDKHDISF